jgi:EAL domain-containing protein (putative c-di-GMP-specific phosphodiesterase class I)
MVDHGLGEALRVDRHGAAVGRFHRCELASVFQPVFYCQGELAGWQGLVRVNAYGDAGLSPWGLFSAASADDQLIGLDRRCRLLHTLNFFAAERAGGWLQVCVHHRLLTAVGEGHGREFRRLLDLLGVAPERLIVALPAQAGAAGASDAALTERAIASYRLQGFGVAATAQHATQITLLASQGAQIVRIDAAQLPDDALQCARLADRLPAGVSLHVKRIETERELRRAGHCGATLLQGYLFGSPAPLTSVARGTVADTAVQVRAHQSVAS